MADYLTTDTELTSVANAIRTKGGTSAQLVYPTGFVSAINAIPTGGGTLPTCTMTVTEDPDVICSDFSGGAPTGTYVAIVDYGDSGSGDPGGHTLMIFVGTYGVTSLSEADGQSINASFFMNDWTMPGVLGSVYSTTSYAWAMTDTSYAEDDSSLLQTYAGTYTATVIEF